MTCFRKKRGISLVFKAKISGKQLQIAYSTLHLLKFSLIGILKKNPCLKDIKMGIVLCITYEDIA
jgi:hypothetical protein